MYIISSIILIFLDKIMQKALTPVNSLENNCSADGAVEETDTPLSPVSIRGRLLCNLQFADDIDLLGRSEELQQLTRRLEETVAEYGMETSSNKSKIIVNSIILEFMPLIDKFFLIECMLQFLKTLRRHNRHNKMLCP